MQTLLYYTIIILHRCKALNTYNESTGPNGEDIWQSTSDFIPQAATSYGTIKIGQVMVMEFDFIFNNRSDFPRPGFENNFFRIGHSGLDGGCSEGTRYPSMWLESGDGSTGRFDISVTTGAQCDFSHFISATEYGEIPQGIWMHITITIDYNTVSFAITGAQRPNYKETWQRTAITREEHIGDEVPVWFMSDKASGTGYNIGDATFKNIKITSYALTFPPTANPTAITSDPSISPTEIPSANPSTSEPSGNPSALPTNAPVTSLPTVSPLPTTSMPTDSPITYAPTDNPVTALSTTDIPVEEGQVIEVSTTEIVDIKDKDDDDPSVTALDSTTIAMIIAVCAVGCCIFIGAAILYNKKRDVSDDKGDRTVEQDVFMEGDKKFSINVHEVEMHQKSNKKLSPVYTPDGVVKQKAYLSKAQKQELYSTAQGPRTDHVEECQDAMDYLSAAQREELKKNGMNTPGNVEMNEEDKYLSAAQKEELKKLTPGKINVQCQKEESEHASDDEVVTNMTPGIEISSPHAEWNEIPQPPHIMVDNEGSEKSEVLIENKMTIGVEELDDNEYDVQYDDEEEDEEEEIIDEILEDEDQEYDNYETIQ